jgi:hypothetical protein
MKKGLIFFVLCVVLLAGCSATSATTSTTIYSRYDLEYRLLANFDNYFWCNPYQYPIARENQEKVDAVQQFLQIRTNEAEFTAILNYLNMDHKAEYTDEEKLLIFRQHEILTIAIDTTPGSGGSLSFVLRIGKGQGELIEGNITETGKITIKKREPSINICPICLAKQTLIDTPSGPVPVEDIREGTIVWTQDSYRNRVAAPVIETSKTSVPLDFRITLLKLSDGREIKASAGHPTADGRPLGGYRVGDLLDGSIVIVLEQVAYQNTATYDIKPSGVSGAYWANGILLKSTLTGK